MLQMKKYGNGQKWQRIFIWFFRWIPALPNVKTEVEMTYDKTNLYLLAKCFDAPEKGEIVESLRRDWNFQKNDNFLVFIDPFDDQTDGFAFGTNAENAQWDGLMYDGGSVDLNWDNKWVSAVKHYADSWVLEMAIPLKTLRFKKGVTKWGINFSRNDLRTTEKSSWAPVPRQFPTAALAYTGTLVWDSAPTVQEGNISLIPHLLTGVSKEHIPASPSEFKHEVGLDAKVAVTSSLNLDMTVNPDFSQVEVDKQVTNLIGMNYFFLREDSFSWRMATRSTTLDIQISAHFFHDGSDLGIPIDYGGRLSGNLNKNGE